MKTSLKLTALILLSATVASVGLVAACQPVEKAGGDDSGTTNPAGDGGQTDPDGGTPITTPATAIHKVDGLTDERVTGIYCAPGATSCVLSATGSSADKTHVSAFDTKSVNAARLVVSDKALADLVGLIGDVDILGFSKVGDKLVARLDKAPHGFVSATGDPTVAASWTKVKLGTAQPSDMALNAQYGFGFDGTTWVQMRNSFIYTATTPTLTDSTSWATAWSPGGSPEAPSDLQAKKAADPTICNTEVAYSVAPRPVQAGYVAGNAEIILYGAGVVNQTKAPDGAGICISTDQGKTFHIAKLTAEEAAGNNGPTTLTCISKDHCFAAGGQVFQANSAYIYYSTNASAGATSTWKKATLPTLSTNDNTFINSIFFAPDGTHGWAVGAQDTTKALLLKTEDGGVTWTDASASVAALGNNQVLYSGYAADATHFAVGGKGGNLFSTF
ncbi:MAG: hypothetical protein HOO96_21520 [Polyangiaceae bacterium]|nr:hypothetical protein [Polyangiaceae bacterium]